MFGQGRITLFTLFGFPVRFHPSWLIILFLVTWTLAIGYFPVRYENLAVEIYWIMGLIGALGLFISVIIHELCHSVIARKFKLPIHGITLFMFGGASEIIKEPTSPKAEFLIAIVGPLMSLVLAGLFYGIAPFSGPVILQGILEYLGVINLVLAIFNILPAFPLDGGRVLRAGLWQWKGNLEWATRIASRIGSWFGMILIVLGVLGLFGGVLIGGIWWVLIGLFLRSAANSAYQQLLIQKSLQGQPVSRFMQTEPIAVPPDISLKDLVENYFYQHRLKTYPVVQNGKLEGCVDLEQVKSYPQKEWSQHQVAEVSKACPVDKRISPDTEMAEALSAMQQSGQTTLMVTIDDRLVGLLSLPDLLDFLSTKMKLEQSR